MASISARGYTAPVGFDGEAKISSLVFGVRAASSWSTVTRNPSAAVVGTSTTVAPARRIVSG